MAFATIDLGVRPKEVATVTNPDKRGSKKAGPSNAFIRAVTGRSSGEKYAATVKRAASIRQSKLRRTAG
jgi:hypothetical protein